MAPKSSKRPRSAVFNRFLLDYSDEDMKYWKSLPPDKRRFIVDMQDGVADANDDIPTRFKILSAGFKPAQTRRLLKFMESSCSLGENASKKQEYLEFVCRVPTPMSSPITELPGLEAVAAKLDAKVHGQEKAKRAILRVLAQWLLNPSATGMSIGLHGPFGTAKTQICMTLADALGMPFALFALGGMTDAACLVGHDYTYIGAQPGSIARAFVKGGQMNQVFMFDELDKVSHTAKGDEISNVLVHMTDETQNRHFQDKYVGDIDIDVSRCLMVFTFNELYNIPPVLQDRMTIIDVQGYSVKEKIEIASSHLVPDALKAFGLRHSAHESTMQSPEFIRQAIVDTAEEKGVRALRRAIRAVCAEINLRKAMTPAQDTSTSEIFEILHAETAQSRQKSATHLSMYV